MKIQSKILIRVYLICAIILLLILSLIILYGVQSSNDKLFISIFMGSISILCILGMALEIRHYVLFNEHSIIIKNRFKTYEILLSDLKNIEVYDSIWQDSRYLSMHKNKIVFKLDNFDIKFVYYTYGKIELKREIKQSFGNNYMGKLISKRADDKYQIIYEFVGSIILTLISMICIIAFSINYSWYLYLSIAIFLIGAYLTYHNYSKLRNK